MNNYMKVILSAVKTYIDKVAARFNNKVNEIDEKIPTKVSQLENDKVFVTEEYVDNAINNIDIPEGFSGSWNDLEDKPFDETSEVITILPEATLTYNEDSGSYIITESFEVVTNKKYIVSINGVAYETEAKEINEDGITVHILGDGSVVDDTMFPATGEPFFMGILPADEAMAAGMGAEIYLIDGSTDDITLSIGCINTTIHYLDSKFIKDMYGSSAETLLSTTFIGTEYKSTAVVPFRVDNKYSVNWNNIEYTDLVAVQFGKAIGIGVELNDNNIPFLIATSPDEESDTLITYVVGTELSEDSVTKVSVYGEKIHQIPEKYIPSTYITEEVIDDKLSELNTQINETIEQYPHVGKNVEGQRYIISGNIYTSSSGAEVFNNYTKNKAIGTDSHAEGTETITFGISSHAEGFKTLTKGDYSHAEGQSSRANGISSHAEGFATYANGDYSHAEGYKTAAYSLNQHVQGRYNITDNNNIYAHIVGNGTTRETSEATVVDSSNAHTLDWKGNAWFAGDVYVSSTSGTNKDAGSKKLATEDYVATELSDYYLKSEADTLHTELHDYVDTEVAALVNAAPETLDTLGELATAFEENHDMVETLNEAIAFKANQSDLDKFKTETWTFTLNDGTTITKQMVVK